MVTKARQLAEFIANADVDSDEIATGAVSASKLAATLDLSSKTIVMPDVASFNITSGNVGIGTSSPVRDIQIGDNTGSAAVVSLQTTTTGNGSIYFGDNTATSAEYAGMLRYSHSDNAMQFWTNSTEKMRITSTGSVGIGTTTPSSPKFSGTASGILELKGSKPSFNIQESDVTDAHFNMSMSNGSAYLGATGTGNLVFATGTASWAEKMRITSAGNVGIGTSSPATSISGSAQGLAIQHSNVPFLSLEHTGASGKRYTLYSNSAGALVTYDEDASTERMRISSGGLVGIGTDSPASKLHLQSTNSSVIKLETTAANTYPGINFINDAQRYDMQIDGATDSFRIYDSTASTSRLVLDTSGNLLVGKTSASGTSASSGDDGLEIRPTYFSFQSNTVASYLNTRTNGDISVFQKDGTAVGSIGSEGGDALYIQSGTTSGTGLLFSSNSTAIRPARNGVTVHNTLDLGSDTRSFKDLYLSGRLTNDGTGGVAVDSGGDVEIIQEGTGRLKAVGGIFIGGTASGNHLDDYEEGSWLPSLGAASVNPTVGYTTQVGHYTKIGNLVTVSCRIVTNSRSGGSGHLIVRGLPFTVAAAEAYASATIGFNYNWNTPPQHAGAQANTVTVLLYQDGRTNAVSGSGDIAASGSSYLNLSCSYITNS